MAPQQRPGASAARREATKLYYKWHKINSLRATIRSRRSGIDPDCFCGSILEPGGARPLTRPDAEHYPEMTQHSEPEPIPSTSHRSPDCPPDGGSAESATDPIVERSRFSRWLASFGLGELQNPLLTRDKGMK